MKGKRKRASGFLDDTAGEDEKVPASAAPSSGPMKIRGIVNRKVNDGVTMYKVNSVSWKCVAVRAGLRRRVLQVKYKGDKEDA